MDLREQLASYAHEAWMGWMVYMFGKCIHNPDGTLTIPAPLVERWTRQMTTSYTALPEAERKSDRAEADKILEIVGDR